LLTVENHVPNGITGPWVSPRNDMNSGQYISPDNHRASPDHHAIKAI
jgi:hypothetical protein